MDGLVVVAACDKNMPAMMSMARLNIPSIFVYGGAILVNIWIEISIFKICLKQLGHIQKNKLRMMN